MASNESKCRDCGETLVWDDKKLSASGKKIPYEKNGNKHNCPFSKFNKDKDKTLGDKTPMEALSSHERELKDIKKRLDSLEIEVKWGDKKTGTVPTPKPKGEIDWEGLRTDTVSAPPETDPKDKLEKFRK